MSYVIAAPETLAAATADIAGIGTALHDANLTAAAPTTGALAAGADEVSAADHGVVQRARQGISGPQRPGGGVSRPIRSGLGRGCEIVCERRGEQCRACSQHGADCCSAW